MFADAEINTELHDVGRRAALTVLLFTLLLGASACGAMPPEQGAVSGSEAASPDGAEAAPEGLAKLTAVAAGSSRQTGMSAEAEAEDGGPSVEHAQTDVGSAPPVDPADELEGQLPDEVLEVMREVEGAPVAPGGAEFDTEGLAPDEASLQFDIARATEEAKAGIADVSALVAQQVPMATFTPAPSGQDIDGRLLYVRSGAFYTTDADGENIEKLALEDASMPSLWAPPEDPGRAWLSPDGSRVAFFAGSDAGLWVMDIDGRNNRELVASTLPSESHEVSAGSATQSVKIRPGQDYTLVYAPRSDRAFGVMIDNNEYHVRGQARVRIVHAAEALSDSILTARINGQVEGSPMRFGLSNGEVGVRPGQIRLELLDQSGQRVVEPFDVPIGDREVATLFVHGSNDVRIVPVVYPSGSQPTSGQSRVRVFNASDEPISALVDGTPTTAQGVGGGDVSGYFSVAGVLSQDARRDAEISVFGLRSGEEPVAWSPDSRRLAFLSVADGTPDLFAANVDRGSIERITSDAPREISPVWSPDSRSLAWTTVDEGYGDSQLIVLGDGAEQPAIAELAPVRDAFNLDTGAKFGFPYGVSWIDEDRVAFVPYGSGVALGIWLYDGRQNQLTPALAEPVTPPDYSGQARAWVYNKPDDGGKIYVLPVDGRERMIVAADGYAPRWSPDGEVVTYGEGKSTSPDGWRLRSVSADGSGDRALTDRWPLVQVSPPVPGPDAKRFWLDDGTLIVTKVGRDYGRRDREGVYGRTEAGDDIENLYAIDGRTGAPRQLTDLQKAFYINDVTPSDDGGALGFVAFSYRNRAQQLYTVASSGGKPVLVDGAVRWFAWLD